MRKKRMINFGLMPELLLHNKPVDRETIEERRLLENLALTPEQRIIKCFQLMQLSLRLKKGPLKEPTGKGILLKVNR